MRRINWGIIGCGDVTEMKSGPAFNKVEGSFLAAVMRRDGAKAKDYAQRHHVPRWYDEADELINDPEIDAVYIATPPYLHAEYTIKAAQAGKHIYVEKPMALNHQQCLQMIEAANEAEVYLFTAYYRRRVPYFLKVKELIDSGAAGTPRFVNICLFKPLWKKTWTNNTDMPWRLRPEMAGGGLFMDLACHQLDFLDYLFGPMVTVKGTAGNQAKLYPAEDTVSACFTFENGVIGTGNWCFAAPEFMDTDEIEIIGDKGIIRFSTFRFTPIELITKTGTQYFDLPKPAHVQEGLIRTMVNQLLGIGECPSTGETGARTARVTDIILKDYYPNGILNPPPFQY